MSRGWVQGWVSREPRREENRWRGHQANGPEAVGRRASNKAKASVKRSKRRGPEQVREDEPWLESGSRFLSKGVGGEQRRGLKSELDSRCRPWLQNWPAPGKPQMDSPQTPNQETLKFWLVQLSRPCPPSRRRRQPSVPSSAPDKITVGIQRTSYLPSFLPCPLPPLPRSEMVASIASLVGPRGELVPQSPVCR